MPGSYSAAQVAAARDNYRFWQAKHAPAHVSASFCGNNEGEDGFDDRIGGDKVAGRPTAFGKSQWHKPRRDIILAHTGIDVWSAAPARQNEAIYAEVTAPWSAYRHVYAKLMATTTVEEAVTVLVHDYEQSGSQARDILRRTGMANGWLRMAIAEKW